MLPVQRGRIPYLTRKRSFDLAWGAWAGILAVMTAVGAALTGSQMLMMYAQPPTMILVKYPSLPRSSGVDTTQLDAGTPAFFWGAQGLVFGKISEVTAPQATGRLIMKNAEAGEIGKLESELENWFRENLSGPAEVVAVGESMRRKLRLSFADLAELSHAVEKINGKVFSQPVRPKIVNLDLVNPI